MATPGNIRAGGAAVEISADSAKLSPELKKAEAKVNSWANSTQTLGNEVGKKFGGKVMEAFAGVAVAGTVARIMDGLADNMEAAARGDAFKNVGTVIAESIQQSFQSVPIFGALERMVEVGVGNALWGVDAAAESRIAKSREEGGRRSAALGKVMEEAQRMRAARLADGDPSLTKRDAFEESIGKTLSDLVGAGVPLDKARESVQALRDEFDLLMTEEASKVFDSLMKGYRKVGVEIAKDAEVTARLKEETTALGNAFKAAGLDDVSARAIERVEQEAARATERVRAIEKQKADEKAAEEYAAAVDRFINDPYNSYAAPEQDPTPMARSLSSTGSFSSAIAGRLSSGVTIDRSLEDIKRNTKRTADAVEQNQLSYV